MHFLSRNISLAAFNFFKIIIGDFYSYLDVDKMIALELFCFFSLQNKFQCRCYVKNVDILRKASKQ